MKPRWLYLLLIIAVLMAGARPRFTNAMIAGSAPIQGTTSNTTQTEEEEVHERTATSRQTQRIARGTTPLPGLYATPQYRRFTSASPAVPPVIVVTHNGFGGNITC
ncbi:hypothetical protein [Bremerella alba]|uniref:Uncharacterized protein n=1 Tax=Bremerella alba TaxID=980252 RepID=A0A7V8VA65_9BACT|nr:hypothetical protein [Bremerella alba]MBA2117705.1 hypothetical protein [Bremerella alba]